MKNSYKDFSKVLLEPINDAQIDDDNLEPQFVRIRQSNNAYIYISSVDSDLPNLATPTNLTINAKDLFSRKIRRFAVTDVHLNYRIPNVNLSNNEIIFRSSVSGINHTVLVNVGFYTTAATLITAIVTALNTATGSSGLTFSSVVSTIDPNVYTLNSAGGNYFFIQSATMFKYGFFLVNLNPIQILTNSKVIGPMNLYYTRYIDIVSSEMDMYTKNPSNGTDITFLNANLIRIYLYENNPVIGGPINSYHNYGNCPRWVNYNRTQSLSVIDLKIYDEWGNFLHIHDYGIGSYQSCFWIDITFVTQL